MFEKRTLFLFTWLVFTGLFAYAQEKAASPPRNGAWKSVYDNGQTREKGHYKDAQKQGVWYFYNDCGVVEKKEKYKKGELQWQLFYSKGKITKTIDKNGKVTERPKCGC